MTAVISASRIRTGGFMIIAIKNLVFESFFEIFFFGIGSQLSRNLVPETGTVDTETVAACSCFQVRDLEILRVISLVISLVWFGSLVLPILHHRGCLQCPKETKNTTVITKFVSVIFFVGKEENNPLKTIICYVFLIFSTSSPSWGGASAICHPRRPPRAQ